MALDGRLDGVSMLLTFSYARLDICAAKPVAADAAESIVATTEDVFECEGLEPRDERKLEDDEVQIASFPRA